MSYMFNSNLIVGDSKDLIDIFTQEEEEDTFIVNKK